MAETSAKTYSHLTSGRLLTGNIIWNLVGSGAPVIVAIFSIPILIHRLGDDRFGILTLAWALIGYASFFDVGLGRALTQLVSQKLGVGDAHEVPSLAWTSLLLMLLIGVVGAVAFALISPLLVHRALKIPDVLQSESIRAFYILALSIPVVVSAAGLRGLLEAHQYFKLVNILRIPLGVFTLAGPLLVLPFSRSLVPIVGVLVAVRAAVCVAYLWVCLEVLPEFRRRVAWHTPSIGPLLRFGGWMTVSNIISPLMVTLDRFVIAALISVTAVAYYATPYEMVTKMLLIPAALLGVMFPAFSTSFANDRRRAGFLYGRSVKLVLIMLFPIILLIIVLAQNGLTFWLGGDFARHSTHVAQWLTVGVLANSLAFVPFSLIQAAGRPDLTAKLHLLELPMYLVLLWWLIRVDGIEGAAIAWTVRMVLDAFVLFLVAKRLLPDGLVTTPRMKGLVGAAVLILLLAVLPQALISKAVFLLVAISVFTLLTWFVILTPEEQSFGQRLLLRNK